MFTYKTKHNLFKPTITILNKLGFSWTTLGNTFGRYVLPIQVSLLGKKLEESPLKKRKPLKIVFLSMLGGFQTNNSIQVLIALVLKKRGHDVTFVLCDQALPICEMTGSKNHHERESICKKCFQFGNSLFKETGGNVIFASSLVQDVNQENGRWDKYIKSLVLRYFKVGELDRENGLMNEVYTKAKKAAKISASIGKGIANLKPDRVLFAHGVYTTRGPAVEILNSLEIPTISISRAKIAQTHKLNWKVSGDWWDVSATWEKDKEIPLTDSQNRILDDYLHSRRNHERDVLVYNHSPEESEDSLIRKLNLSNDKPIITLFTNVLWDAASAQREIVFKDAISWVIETVKWFTEHSDRQLIVRIHPAEKVIGTQQPFLQILKHEIGVVPENIKILTPEVDVNSWSLLRVTDMGLVHTSTVGLELALEGKPCVCVADTHYRGKGFTIDATDKKQYYDLILEARRKEGFDLNRKILSRRYAFLNFIRLQLPLPFFNPKSHISINSFNNLNLSEIMEHPSVKTIMNGIENMDEFLLNDEYVEELYPNN